MLDVALPRTWRVTCCLESEDAYYWLKRNASVQFPAVNTWATPHGKVILASGRLISLTSQLLQFELAGEPDRTPLDTAWAASLMAEALRELPDSDMLLTGKLSIEVESR